MDHFDRLVAEGEAYLEELCLRGQEESLTLEFKTSEDVKSRKLSRIDRRNIGKELSAFSNSIGGVLIWGVGTEKGPEGLDRAKYLAPIANIRKIYADVIEYSKDYLSPRNEDVEVEICESRNDSAFGYFFVRVGRSERELCPNLGDAA
ncbi:ATP-binding protein [Psychromarinibacter sp. C21-152]|uniref:ATP-binding protein n=1 Tax=Psychromarinibacter sediminicola TaxID=3033385 RepID=A0AAE3NXI6_9RHOB|nr:ATP-binding protein [Psychromarinibacter sediminicola]MDF0603796.1 ATP-binding protein [Psychromarinibacter sediminicola]